MSGVVDLWESRNGRWYIHRYAGGHISDQNDYASRRSARRAARSRWPGLPIVFWPNGIPRRG